MTLTNIGILGGTFDPIHLGHTEPVKVVADYLALDKVLFIPAAIPPHKTSPNVSAKERAAMVNLACNEQANFHCDLRELERTGHSYTVDTLKELKQSYPEQALFFIIGLDSLLTFTQWRNYREILSLCHLVVNTRPEYLVTQANEQTKALINAHQVNDLSMLSKKATGGIIFVPDANNTIATDNLDPKKQNLLISSTTIRQRLAAKQCCKHLLNAQVLAFINKNQLYR